MNATPLLQSPKNPFIWAIMQGCIFRNGKMAPKMAATKIFQKSLCDKKYSLRWRFSIGECYTIIAEPKKSFHLSHHAGLYLKKWQNGAQNGRHWNITKTHFPLKYGLRWRFSIGECYTIIAEPKKSFHLSHHAGLYLSKWKNGAQNGRHKNISKISLWWKI